MSLTPSLSSPVLILVSVISLAICPAHVQDMPAQSYYAVFDGHVGVEAAVYASLHMLSNIVRHPSFREDFPTAIKAGIKKTDEVFCRKVCMCV